MISQAQIQLKSAQDINKTPVLFSKTPSENLSAVLKSQGDEIEAPVTFSLDKKPEPLNLTLEFDSGLRKPTRAFTIQPFPLQSSIQNVEEAKRVHMATQSNLDSANQTDDEEDDRDQELEEIMRSKQLIEQIKASGSDATLKQVLRRFKESKSNDRNLRMLEEEIMEMSPDDVDLGEVRDELLGVYDRTQKKTATRVLKFANDRDRRQKELLRLQVLKNSKATEVIATIGH